MWKTLFDTGGFSTRTQQKSTQCHVTCVKYCTMGVHHSTMEASDPVGVEKCFGVIPSFGRFVGLNWKSAFVSSKREDDDVEPSPLPSPLQSQSQLPEEPKHTSPSPQEVEKVASKRSTPDDLLIRQELAEICQSAEVPADEFILLAPNQLGAYASTLTFSRDDQQQSHSAPSARRLQPRVQTVHQPWGRPPPQQALRNPRIFHSIHDNFSTPPSSIVRPGLNFDRFLQSGPPDMRHLFVPIHDLDSQQQQQQQQQLDTCNDQKAAASLSAALSSSRSSATGSTVPAFRLKPRNQQRQCYDGTTSFVP